MAIYTSFSKREITRLVDEFALGELVSYSGMRTGSVNTHYLIETKRAKFFAKIDEENKIFRVFSRSRPKAAGITWNFKESA